MVFLVSCWKRFRGTPIKFHNERLAGILAEEPRRGFVVYDHLLGKLTDRGPLETFD